MILTEDFTRIAVMTLERPRTDVGGPGLPPIDEDDEWDDDDSEWSDWDWLNKTFGTKLFQWVESSSVVRKIAEILYEPTFSGEPEISIYNHYNKTNQPPWSGDFKASFSWKYTGSHDVVYDEALALLRRSDLYKVFDKQPNELWDVLDKGTVSEWVFHQVMFGISGMRPYYHPVTRKQLLFHAYYALKQYSDKYEEMLEKKINYGPLHIEMGDISGFFTYIKDGHFFAGVSMYCKYESGHKEVIR
jgi:hypothetical protein